MLIINALDVTVDYFDYKYEYKLLIGDNKNGFDLPPISVCTEINVFFDKQKIIYSFEVNQELINYERRVDKEFNEIVNKCLYFVIRSGKLDLTCDYMDNMRNYNVNRFFVDYERRIFNEMTFDEMNSLTITANELFECSAKLDLRYESIDTNVTEIDCFYKFRVLTNIYGNNDFGICYTFFDRNYRIYLKDKDILKIGIKYETQKRFLHSGVLTDNNYKRVNMYESNYHLHSNRYFRLYLFANEENSKRFADKYTAIESTNVGLECELKFKIVSVKSLSTPHMERCDNEVIDWKTCYKKCIEEQITTKKVCISNPFTKTSSVLFDSMVKEIKFCNDSKLDTKICERNCIKNCYQVYYRTILEDKGHNFNRNFNIKIKYRNTKNFHYIAIALKEVKDLMSDIGGLFGLWFGFSFIDIYYVFNLFSFRLKRLLLGLLKLKFFRKIKLELSKIIINVLFMLKTFEKIQFKMILKIISFPFFAVQIYRSFYEYLQYSTQISVEFVDYSKSENMYSIEDFPAITVCNEHRFENYLFDKNYLTSINSIISQINLFKSSSVIKKKYFNLNLKTTNVFIRQILNYINFVIKREDLSDVFLDLNIFQKFLDYLDVNNSSQFNKLKRKLDFTELSSNFYGQHHRCIEHGEFRQHQDTCGATHIISPYGKCKTYHSDVTNRSNKFIDFIIVDEFRPKMYNFDLDLNSYLRTRVFIHPSTSCPISDDEEFILDDYYKHRGVKVLTKINKVVFLELPEPYDTGCQSYHSSNQFECLNHCYYENYLVTFKCIPTSNSDYTFSLANLSNRTKLCSLDRNNTIDRINNAINIDCHKKCGHSCVQVIYDLEYQQYIYNDFSIKKILQLSFYLKQNYIKIIFKPKTSLLNVFINIVNILSLWHGITILQIITSIFKAIQYQINNFNLFTNLLQLFNLQKLRRPFKVRIFAICNEDPDQNHHFWQPTPLLANLEPKHPLLASLRPPSFRPKSALDPAQPMGPKHREFSL